MALALPNSVVDDYDEYLRMIRFLCLKNQARQVHPEYRTDW